MNIFKDFNLSIKRINVEHEQSLVRIVVALLIFVGFLIYGFTYESYDEIPSSLSQIYFEMPIFIALSILLSVHIQMYPGVNPVRRIFGIVLDSTQCAIGMIIGDAYAAMIFFVLSWVIVGNGIRFGYQYLIIASAMSIVACVVGMRYSPYWQNNSIVIYGVMLTNVVVPAYIYGLLRRIEKTTRQLELFADQMKQAAFHDSLTGLANRGLLQESIDKGIQRARRSGEQMAVVFFDLDGFKKVNDTLGHEVGDVLLKRVADIARNRVRSNDTVARLGGDEFVVLLEGLANEQGAVLVASNILHLIQGIEDVNGHPVKVGGSFGIAMFDPSVVTSASVTTRDLLKWADEAMYLAKRAGKGRVVFYRQEAANEPVEGVNDMISTQTKRTA